MKPRPPRFRAPGGVREKRAGVCDEVRADEAAQRAKVSCTQEGGCKGHAARFHGSTVSSRSICASVRPAMTLCRHPVLRRM